MDRPVNDDTIVTSICTSVTARDKAGDNPRAAIVSPGAGEAMAPASRSIRGAGAALICALAACHDPAPIGPPVGEPTTTVPRKAAADPGVNATSPMDTMIGFGDAVLGEVLGDRAKSGDLYLQMLGAAPLPTAVAARVTLRLAQVESPASQSHAIELAARAMSLAPTDPAIVDGAQRLQADVVLVTNDLRPGTRLEVSAEVAALWARAEAKLEGVNRLELNLDLLKRPTDSIEERVYPTRRLVNDYLAIASYGGVAYVAAQYRIATLYADLANEFANARPPGELIYEKALEMQATLNAYEVEYVGAAQRAYRDCLAAPQSNGSELWRVAAETALRVMDVLSDRGRRRR